MGGGTRLLQVRSVASSWFPVLVVVLVVLMAVGGWATYTAHAAPGSTDEQSERVHWTVAGSFEHSADVTRENPVFDVGETLSNRGTYFTTASPVLDGRFIATYTGAETDLESVSLNATLVTRAVDEETVFWTHERSLQTASASGVASGETTAVEFSLNASALAERQAEIESELGSTPGETESAVVVAITAAGTADGQPAELSTTHRLPISVDGDTYSVGSTQPVRESMTTTEIVSVPREYGPLRSAGGPLLFVAALAALSVLGIARDREALELTPAERRELQFQEDRAAFDEWIVTVRLPEAVHDRPRATADSLADLVDFAIDTDSGVVEDPDTGTFYAVGDELLVAYERPEFAGDSGNDTVGDGGSQSEAPDSDAVKSAAESDSNAARAGETSDSS